MPITGWYAPAQFESGGHIFNEVNGVFYHEASVVGTIERNATTGLFEPLDWRLEDLMKVEQRATAYQLMAGVFLVDHDDLECECG